MTLLLPPRHGQREDAGDAAGCSHSSYPLSVRIFSFHLLVYLLVYLALGRPTTWPGELESARPDIRVTTTDGNFIRVTRPQSLEGRLGKRSADSDGPTRTDRAGYRNTPATTGSGRGPSAATTRATGACGGCI